jgi:hypothetical protein
MSWGPRSLRLTHTPLTNGPAALKGTYLGTVRSDGSSQINFVFGGVAANGTAALLGVWNMYNRVDVSGFVADSTSSWTYTSGTVRSANASATMRVSWVAGIQEDFVSVDYVTLSTGASSGAAAIGLGLDVTNAISGRVGRPVYDGVQSINAAGNIMNRSLGFHFAQAVEEGDGSNVSTFFGAISSLQVSGLTYQGRF